MEFQVKINRQATKNLEKLVSKSNLTTKEKEETIKEIEEIV